GLGVGRRNQHEFLNPGAGWPRVGPSIGPAVKIRADYSHGRPNCNAAGKAPQLRHWGRFEPRLAVQKPLGLRLPPPIQDLLMDAKTPAADDLTDTLRRIAEALERLSPRVAAAPDLSAADAFVWHPDGRRLVPVPKVNRVDMSLLR